MDIRVRKCSESRGSRGLAILAMSCCCMALGETTARATLIFDTVSITVQASSQFDTVGTYAPYKLFDGPITVADLGTTNDLQGQYASSGTGNEVYEDYDFNPVVSTDYASPVSADSIVYAQRSGQGGVGADKVDFIDIWFTQLSFTPVLGTGDPANDATPPGLPNEIIDITDRTDSLLTEYAFPDHASLTSAHVTMQFIGDPGENPGTNPGGYEFRLTEDSTVPEPASLSIMAIGCTSLLVRRPTKRARSADDADGEEAVGDSRQLIEFAQECPRSFTISRMELRYTLLFCAWF